MRERLGVVRRFRQRLAREAEQIASDLAESSERPVAEVLSAQVLPLLEACRFLERYGERTLNRKRWGGRGRPWWLWGVRSEVRRVPWGVVLILGAGNYPLFLPGVQALQVLAAGNATVLKPGRGGAAAGRRLAALLADAGLPDGVLTVTGEGVAEAESLIDAGPDRVVLTGSAATGRAVLRRCAESLIPVTCELSGCDAMFVLPGADVQRVAKAVAFGLRLNGSATCIAPRRVLVVREMRDAVERAVEAAVGRRVPDASFAEPRSASAWGGEGVEGVEAWVEEALERGARVVGGGGVSDASSPPLSTALPRRGERAHIVLTGVTSDMAIARADMFLPVVSLMEVRDVEEALRVDAACPYALGASVFGPVREATALARRVRAGSVCVNDIIVPTADPRLPFGGSGESGFGVTRGVEGLLEMTRPMVVSVRRGGLLRHLEEPGDRDAGVLAGYARWVHGGWFGSGR